MKPDGVSDDIFNDLGSLGNKKKARMKSNEN